VYRTFHEAKRHEPIEEHSTNPLFHWEGGLKLTKAGLAIDFCRRQPRAFISHAHHDHMAPHEYALCTPETSALYQFRLGPRPTLELPLRVATAWGGLQLTLYPAGHCLGSAMLLAEDQGHSLLYTGDFKLGPSATAAPAELVPAETLVIESTFGHPDYRWPRREVAIEQLLEVVHQSLAAGRTPVVEAYALGKAQEVTRLLAQAGLPVAQHRAVHQISKIYESLGVDLGGPTLCERRPAPGEVWIVPPGAARGNPLPGEVRIAVTGWAIDGRTKYRLGVDHAVPLSDHADYDDLVEAVRRVSPRQVFCWHGPESFVDRLQDLGFDAHPLGRPSQRRLF
jgi:Cft2 family RNA processing exonuclease